MKDFIHNRKKHVFIFFILIMYYFIAFWSVFKSGYLYDDVYNYATRGYLVVNNVSIWQMTGHFMKKWFEGAGRCFFFGFYAFFFFAHVGLKGYKVCIILSTLLNGIILNKVVSKMSGNNRLGFLCILVFPVLVSLDCGYFNSMYGFHMLMQMCFLWSLLGILCFQKYLEINNWKWQIASCVFLSLALGTYEVSYVLCVIYFIISIFVMKKMLPAIKKILPQFFVGCAWVCLNWYATEHVISGYAGTTVSIGKHTFWGFLRQLSGTTCIVNNILNLPLIESAAGLFGEHWQRYLLFVFSVLFLLCITIIKNKKSDFLNTNQKNSYLCTVLCGIWVIVAPSFLISISQRYQQEVYWGKGYLPSYVSAWGAAICTAAIIDWMIEKSQKGKSLFSILSFLIVITILPNQMLADLSVSNAGNRNYIEDLLFQEAISTGLFENWKKNENVIDGNTVWVEKDVHYSWLLNKKINAVAATSLYIVDENGMSYTDNYNYFSGLEYFWYVAMQSDDIMFLSKCSDLDIFYDESGNLINNFKASQVFVFMPASSQYKGLTFAYEDGSIDNVEFTKDIIYRESERGCVYLIDSKKSINSQTISAYK